MTTQTVICAQCNKPFEKEVNEYNRRIREGGEGVRFFCTYSCGAIYYNAPRKKPPETKVCKCGETFVTMTGSVHCGRRCASLYSLTEEHRRRLEVLGKANQFTPENHLVNNADGLRVREWPKYVAINKFLNELDIQHGFEVPVVEIGRIYDLAIIEACVYVEFDEGHHRSAEDIEIDNFKDAAARIFGWSVFRVNVAGFQAPYPVELLSPLLRYYGWWYKDLQRWR